MVLVRAAALTAFCALVGLLAWRRYGGFYGALAAAFVTAGVASGFAVDRPYLVTFLLLASSIAIPETRRSMWLLPPLLLFCWRTTSLRARGWPPFRKPVSAQWHSFRVPRNLLDLSAKVDVETSRVVVTLEKRAHNPHLVASGLTDKPTPMRWFGHKQLLIRFA